MMYTVEIGFQSVTNDLSDAAIEAFDDLLAVLRMNGQICGREFPTAQTATSLHAFVNIPDVDALEPIHHNSYVQHWLARLEDAGMGGPQVSFLDDPDLIEPLEPERSPTSYILYTTFLSLRSPLRSGDTFAPIPLYRITPTADGEYHDIIRWQSDYQACGSLFLNDRTAQRAVLRELTDVRSALTQQGRAICATIRRLGTIPVYYYLYRWRGRSRAQERKRCCPGCGAAWYLEVPWHDRFDFRCDECLLLSTIATDLP